MQAAGLSSVPGCLPDPEPLEELDTPWRRASCGHTGLGPPLGVTGADLQPCLFPPLFTWLLLLIPGDRVPTERPPSLALGAARWTAVGKMCEPRGRRARGAKMGLGRGTLGPQTLPCSTQSCLPLMNTSPRGAQPERKLSGESQENLRQDA